MKASTLDNRISINSKIRAGKPCITGHRIAVHDLAIWHEHLGMSVAAIVAEYDLAIADVYIGLAYYFMNKVQIDKEIQAAKDEAEQLKKNHVSILDQKLNAVTH